MKVEHKLSPTWAKHLADIREGIANAEQQNWILRGKIAHNDNEIDMMRKHHATTLDVIIEAERLPESKTPYQLSPDGTALVGEIDATAGE
jgi:hypothetical protein